MDIEQTLISPALKLFLEIEFIRLKGPVKKVHGLNVIRAYVVSIDLDNGITLDEISIYRLKGFRYMLEKYLCLNEKGYDQYAAKLLTNVLNQIRLKKG